MKEYWVPIHGFNNYYVSNLGRIKSVDRIIKRTDGIITKKNGKIKIATQRQSNGYLSIRLYNVGKDKLVFVHRVIAKAFIPNPEGKNFVNHIDGNKLNNNISNLEWCTSSENNKHAIITGLRSYKSGCNHRLSFLSHQDIASIREMHKNNVKAGVIKNKYNLSYGAYYNIIKRISYKNE
jgi:hypothetical protein